MLRMQFSSKSAENVVYILILLRKRMLPRKEMISMCIYKVNPM